MPTYSYVPQSLLHMMQMVRVAVATVCCFCCILFVGLFSASSLHASPSGGSAETMADTSEVRVVQPGAPGEATRVLQEGRGQQVRIVQPGAPGEPTRVLVRGRVDDVAQPARIVYPGAPGERSRVVAGGAYHQRDEPAHTEHDVQFMKDMILHHAQALQMTALVDARSENPGLRQMADRMERSQGDEIDQMIQWLERRGEEAPHHLRHMLHDVEHLVEHGQVQHDHDHGDMHGMLSSEQLEELARASGEEFDRLFLEFMIFHHEGAIAMVNELFSQPGAGQETEVFAFAGHVEADQEIEIQRMMRMLQQME